MDCCFWLRCLLLCGLLMPQMGSAVSISDEIRQKLLSITQWLDKMTDATVFDYIYRVNKGAGLNLFEGDIKGYSPTSSMHRSAIRNHQQLWNTRVVPYIIDTSFAYSVKLNAASEQKDSASRKDILAAIDEYHAKTCIRFVQRTTEQDYVHFKQISGCYSNIGRTGGEQEISLMGACLKKGTAIHEMMHAIGFWHEQSRPDRDSWVQIITRNIQGGKEYNFDKLTTAEVDTLGVQYDYGSVMHYSKYAFSKNGNPTILPTRQTNAELGQRAGLSDSDILRINTLYRCDIQLPSTSAVTQQQTKPPKTQPPKTQPPQTQPPKTQPPKTQPTQTQPPQTQQPQTQPPKTQPPQTQPPQTQPPKTQPPQTQPPQTQPPQTQPPQTQPPQTQPPKTQPPQTQPPQTHAPQTRPLPTHRPQTRPPQTQPPQTQPPQTQPPQTQPPQTQPPATHPVQTQPPATQPPTSQPVAVHTYPPVGWTPWSLWTPCDLQCRRSRYRFCLNYDNSYCPGSSSDSSTCPFPCQPAVALGCFNEDPSSPALPSVEGMDSTLSDPYKQRTEAIRKCADYAALHGYLVFALVDDGQCLTGPTAHSDFMKAGASNECTHRGKGSSTASSVFSFQTDVDGGWSLWTGWGQCTTTCGLGRRYRYRRCDNPPPLGNGAKCQGYDQEYSMCNTQTCFVNSKCGMKYHAGGPGSTGLIWVRDYDNFMDCDYSIRTGDPAASISILIQEIDIENSRGCIYDTLMLYDGSSTAAPLVGAFCGSRKPGSFESTSNSVYLKFESDETNTGRGFTVFYNINSRSRKACARPPSSTHAYIYSTGNMVGDRLYYQCHPGYKMIGHSPITCLDQPGFAVWDDVYPRCVQARKRSVNEEQKEACSFEESLCGFTNDAKDDFDWRVTWDETDRVSQLATKTTNNTQYNNHYLHAESTRMQVPGAAARVMSPVVVPKADRYCLHFRFRIDGSSLAVMNVYKLVGDLEELVWTGTGQGIGDNSWKDAAIDVPNPSYFQMAFEAVLGDEIGSSVSIDDVIFTSGPCYDHQMN